MFVGTLTPVLCLAVIQSSPEQSMLCVVAGLQLKNGMDDAPAVHRFVVICKCSVANDKQKFVYTRGRRRRVAAADSRIRFIRPFVVARFVAAAAAHTTKMLGTVCVCCCNLVRPSGMGLFHPSSRLRFDNASSPPLIVLLVFAAASVFGFCGQRQTVNEISPKRLPPPSPWQPARSRSAIRVS